jgi:hypothetical protein
VAEEAARTVGERVVPQEEVLRQRPRGQGEAAEERAVQHALAAFLAGEGVEGEVEEREQQKLLRLLVGAERRPREGSGQQRPDAEGEDGAVEGRPPQHRVAAPEADREHHEREHEEELGREDGHHAGRGEGRDQAALRALEDDAAVVGRIRVRRWPPRAA